MISDEFITKSLAKTKKNILCEMLIVPRKKLGPKFNFLEYSQLKKLDCSQNKIKFLDGTLPETLLDLNCSNNLIVSLDNLPSNIRVLVCDHNQIISLDNLPAGIVKLDCSFNELVELDNLPPCLEYLFCNNNYIQSLNNLPVGLKYLYCQNNNLKIELKNIPNLEKIIL